MASMRANVYTSITYCVIKTPSNLSRSRRSKISILAMYIHLVEPKLLIKLNIVCNASDNEQKKIYKRHSISIVSVCRQKKRSFFSFFSLLWPLCYAHPQASTFEYIYISRASTRVHTTNRFILLTTTIQLAAHTHTHTHRNSRNDVCILVRVHICVYECTLKS